MPNVRNKYNRIEKSGVTTKLFLNGNNGGTVTIDSSDAARVVEAGSWNRNGNWQVSCKPAGQAARGAKLYLHRFLIDAKADQNVDFLDGDKTNYRKKNLLVIRSTRKPWGSMAGVTYAKDRGKYRAFPSVKGKRVDLGYYSTEEEARAAVAAFTAELRAGLGTFFDKNEGGWRSYHKSTYLGIFKTEDEAIQRRREYVAGTWKKPERTPGISFDQQHQKWRAQSRDGRKYVGRFETKELAIAAQNVYHQTHDDAKTLSNSSSKRDSCKRRA